MVFNSFSWPSNSPGLLWWLQDREIHKLHTQVNQLVADAKEASTASIDQEMMCHNLGAELSRVEAVLSTADVLKKRFEAHATQMSTERDRFAAQLAETQSEVNVSQFTSFRLRRWLSVNPADTLPRVFPSPQFQRSVGSLEALLCLYSHHHSPIPCIT